MNWLAACLLGLGVSSLGMANDLSAERIWTGTNGKTIRGIFVSISADGDKADIATSTGIVSVALANLCEADRTLITTPPASNSSTVEVRGDPSAFKTLPAPDRTKCPVLSSKDFGGTNDGTVVAALWHALIWWDQEQVIAIPQKGDFERRAKRALDQLTRSIGKNSGSSATDAQKGMEKYFARELGDIATCRVKCMQNSSYFTPKNLSRYTVGANAVVLRMSLIYTNGRSYSQEALLESIDDSGKFSFIMFGKRFSGQMRLVTDPKSPGFAQHGVVHQLHLNSPQDLPAYILEKEPAFFLGAEPWNAAIIVKPFVFATPGKPSPAPADPLFDPQPPKTTSSQ